MTAPDLPNDVVEEILCHVPARSMKRLRSISKKWNDLFNDRSFTRKHFDKAAKEFPLLMLTKYYCIFEISVNLDDPISVEIKGKHSLLDPQSSDEFEIGQVFHCDGLLLCTCKDDFRTVVWNPCTGETRWIKTGNHFSMEGRCFAFGYCRQDKKKNKSYKISVIYSYSRKSEVYEFDSDSWRIVDDIAPGWSIGYSDHSVSLKGKSYCFGLNLTEMRDDVSLLRFDFAREKYEPVPLPYKQKYDSYEAVSVSVVREEKLTVLLQRKVNSKTEIWLTNKIDEDDETKAVVSWSLVLTLDLSIDLQISNFGYFVLDEEKKVVVCCQKWMDLEDRYVDKIYIVGEDSKVTQVDYGSDIDYSGCYPVIFNYVPGLVQIEGAGNKRQRGD